MKREENGGSECRNLSSFQVDERTSIRIGKPRVAFRVDQAMIDAVEDRIERDGITLSAFMRSAVRDALRSDPGIPLPALKGIALREADEPTVRAFMTTVRDRLNDMLGDVDRPALAGAPATTADYGMIHVDLQFMGPGQTVPDPERTFAL
jgi:hypothetical protein